MNDAPKIVDLNHAGGFARAHACRPESVVGGAWSNGRAHATSSRGGCGDGRIVVHEGGHQTQTVTSLANIDDDGERAIEERGLAPSTAEASATAKVDPPQDFGYAVVDPMPRRRVQWAFVSVAVSSSFKTMRPASFSRSP